MFRISNSISVGFVLVLVLSFNVTQTLAESMPAPTWPGHPGGAPGGAPEGVTCASYASGVKVAFLDGHYNTESGFPLNFKYAPKAIFETGGEVAFNPNLVTACLPAEWDNGNNNNNMCEGTLEDGSICDGQLVKSKPKNGQTDYPDSVIVTITVTGNAPAGIFHNGICYQPGMIFDTEAAKQEGERTRISEPKKIKVPILSPPFYKDDLCQIRFTGPLYHLELTSCGLEVGNHVADDSL